MSVEAVVFDIGNVLVEWRPEAFYDSVIGPERRRRLFSEVDLDGMNKGVDLGAELSESVERLAEEHPQWAAEIRLWRDRWIDMASPAIDETARLLRLLRAGGIPVFSLTNFGRETLEIAKAHYPVLREFDREFVSAHLGMMKPEAAIFAHVEHACGIEPGKLLFTDDRRENVEAAARRGWKTHLFEGPQGWARRLAREGLLGEPEVLP